VVPLNDAIRATVLSSELVIVRAASVKEISVVQETRNAKARAQNCFEALSDDGDLTLIKDKVSLVGAGEQTFSMLVDNSKPTTEEQKALLIWGNKRDVCFKEVRKALDAQGTAPAIKNVLTSGSHTAQMLLIDLYNGKLTYAEFANRRQDLTQVINEAIANIQSELQKQSAEAKARADQLALQAQQNMISAYQATNQVRQTQQMINQQQQQGQQTQQMINQQQQIINQQRMPINQSRTPITCQSIGNTMTCY
jgi:Skp family chaperone for outer membrane proteins